MRANQPTPVVLDPRVPRGGQVVSVGGMRTISSRHLPRTVTRRPWLGPMFHYLGAAAMAMLNERLFDTVRSRPGKQLLSAVTAAAVANVVDRQLRRAAAAAPRRAPALLIAGSAIALGLAALAMVARRQTTRR